MPGETEMHKILKKEACRWLFGAGYRCIAAEVRVEPLGIIDAVGTALFRPYHNYLGLGREMHQVCFIECKASRSDYLRDMADDGQLSLFLESKNKTPRKRRRRRRPIELSRLGKFASCLVMPHANLHYVMAPAGVIQKKDLPPRWGLLSYGEGGVGVVVRADWIETASVSYIESAIARTLTADIYRADARAMNSINREIFAQQQSLSEKIRAMKPRVVLYGGEQQVS